MSETLFARLVVLLPFAGAMAVGQTQIDCSHIDLGTLYYAQMRGFDGSTGLFDFALEALLLRNELCEAKASGASVFLKGPGSPAAQLRPRAAAQGSLYGVGSRPVVYADLNGDGIPDLVQVTASNNGGSVTVELLNSAGITSTTSFPVGSTTINEIVVADFNGDGFPDLAIADDGGGTAPGAVWILLNNGGSGTFKPATKTTVTAGPYHLFAADFNGDGNMDVATANDHDGSISVLFGKGDGTFQAPTPLTGVQYAGSLVAADFSGTGRADLAVIDINANRVVVFQANANNTFQAAQTFSAGAGSGYLIYADLNNDGLPDLAVASTNSNAVVFLINNGKGGFTTSAPYMIGAAPYSLAILPLSNGSFDLLSADEITGKVLADFGAGDGTLSAPVLTYTGTNPTSVATGDINGDGKQDAVVLEPSTNSVYVLLNSGNGVFAAPVPYSVQSPNAAALVALTNGGKPDLVVASGSGNVEVLPNNGAGGFGAPGPFPSGTSAVQLAIADFNGDGNPDVAVANGGSFSAGASVLMGDGKGSLGTPATYLPSQSGSAIATADFNNDGHPDLVVATANANGGGVLGNPLSVTVLMNTGTGTFNALPPIYTIAATSQFNGIFQIVTGDFNGDGKIDLAVLQQNQVPQIQILLGNGDGTFRTGALLPTEFGANTAVAADMNGDGYIDLVVGHCCGQTDDTYLLGNGDGTFQSEVDFPAGASPQGLALADWTGTGKADLAVVGQVQMDLPGAKGYFVPLHNSFAPSVVSGASFTTGPLAPSEIATLKGNLLASSTANQFPLPTTEGGATVTLVDSTGKSQPAPLYYVSPKQINFEVPANVALGNASISLTETDGTVVVANVQITNIAPGIFQNTGGLAAAEALVVNGTTQTLDQVYQVGAGNSIVPLPIDLSQGQVYLVLYGTGIRNARNVTVTVGGVTVPVPFFGAQGTFAGEDQINVGPLPTTLAGMGKVNIVLTADGQAANTVNVTIK